MKTLLIIGHTFPEPSTTAAGIRMMQLIDLFLEEGYSLTFASTAIPSERSANLDAFGIRTVGIHLNDPSFDTFIRQLNPSMVLFDRYLTEEQFGWRVAEGCPHSLRILDTEDLHFLRKAREIAFNNKLPVQQADLYTDTAKRELASMLRCDLSLIISEAEMELLQNTFSIPATLLHYLPLFVEVASEAIVHTLPDFHSRSGFMTVGNLLHAPNVASVRMLKTSLWPEIRKRLPAATLYVYGAYASQEISSFHNEKEGFLICGWIPSVAEVMRQARLCLAPLPFGAGLKGKLLEAMQNGLPSVTTRIGAEGLCGALPFAGRITEAADAFVDASVALYTEKVQWEGAQSNGFQLLQARFQKQHFSAYFKETLVSIQNGLTQHRKTHFIGQILQHHSLQSTKYLSKWIEEKNKETRIQK